MWYVVMWMNVTFRQCGQEITSGNAISFPVLIFHIDPFPYKALLFILLIVEIEWYPFLAVFGRDRVHPGQVNKEAEKHKRQTTTQTHAHTHTPTHIMTI